MRARKLLGIGVAIFGLALTAPIVAGSPEPVAAQSGPPCVGVTCTVVPPEGPPGADHIRPPGTGTSTGCISGEAGFVVTLSSLPPEFARIAEDVAELVSELLADILEAANDFLFGGDDAVMGLICVTFSDASCTDLETCDYTARITDSWVESSTPPPSIVSSEIQSEFWANYLVELTAYLPSIPLGATPPISEPQYVNLKTPVWLSSPPPTPAPFATSRGTNVEIEFVWQSDEVPAKIEVVAETDDGATSQGRIRLTLIVTPSNVRLDLGDYSTTPGFTLCGEQATAEENESCQVVFERPTPEIGAEANLSVDWTPDSICVIVSTGAPCTSWHSDPVTTVSTFTVRVTEIQAINTG